MKIPDCRNGEVLETDALPDMTALIHEKVHELTTLFIKYDIPHYIFAYNVSGPSRVGRHIGTQENWNKIISMIDTDLKETTGNQLRIYRHQNPDNEEA